MANTYEGNGGDYVSYAEDDNDYTKQRKVGGPLSAASGTHNGGDMMSPSDCNHLNEKANEYVRDCVNEKARMDRKFPIAEKLLDNEIEKVQTTGRIPSREQKYADIYREKPLRVSQKVLVPIREHPKFNFVGKLLGPKGNSLRRLQEETMCKMTVLGRNSMRDRVKEEELRNSKDPKYAHLNSDLHVEISTVAPPAEAYARIAYAMAELRKYLIPDSNDVIRQEQLRELMDNTHLGDDQKSINFKKLSPHQTSSGTGILSGTAAGGVPGGGGIVLGSATASSNFGSQGKNAPQPPPQQYRQTQQTSSALLSPYNKNNIAPKQKVMSILEKARSAMDESYGRGYDDNMQYEHLQTTHNYESYSYAGGHNATGQTMQNSHGSHGPQQNAGIGSGGGGGGGGGGLNTMNSSRESYETADYDTNDYNRRHYYQNSPSYGATIATGIQPNNSSLNPNHNPNRSHVNR